MSDVNALAERFIRLVAQCSPDADSTLDHTIVETAQKLVAKFDLELQPVIRATKNEERARIAAMLRLRRQRIFYRARWRPWLWPKMTFSAALLAVAAETIERRDHWLAEEQAW